jgi:arylsulfatase A-like enzyme
MEPRRQSEPLALIVAAAIALVGCHSDVGPWVSYSAALDPELLYLGGTLHYSFDGRGEGIVLGGGWWPPEVNPSDRENQTFAWASAGPASIHLDRFSAPGATDLVARCAPLVDPGAWGRQRVVVSLSNNIVAETVLSSGWQTLRWRLPSSAKGMLDESVNLQFSYSARPKDLGLTPPDLRSLSVMCSFIGLVPPGSSDLSEGPAGAADIAGTSIPINSRSALSFPVPPRSRVRLRLKPDAASNFPCKPRFELRSRSGRRTVLALELREAELVAEGRWPTEEPGLLRIVADGPCDSQAADKKGWGLPLEHDWLALSRLPRHTQPAKPHVFLYVIDTARRDAVFESLSKTNDPALQSMRSRFVEYPAARSASSWTLPSVTSLLTGLLPDRHGVMQGDRPLPPAGPETLAQRLRRAGYQTLGISNSFLVGPKYGLDRGFDSFLLSDQLHSIAVHSNEVRRVLRSWLVSQWNPDRPIFAYVHTVEPHAPYEDMQVPVERLSRPVSPKDDTVRRLNEAYRREIDRSLREFGRFLALLEYFDLLEDSLVILTSDHGEEFGEHGGLGHGRTLFSEVIRVPLWVRYPRGAGGGARVDRDVSLVDVLPTLLQATGTEGGTTTLDGDVLPRGSAASMASRWTYAEVHPASNGPQDEVDFQSLIHSSGVHCLRSRNGRDRFHLAIPSLQVFDLLVDPSETRRLQPPEPRIQFCEKEFGVFQAARPASREAAARSVGADALDHLRALGYIK